jgi:hypothetical protein
MKGLIISPRGLEHAVDTLEEAVRFVIISSEGELGKDNFNDILAELKRNPSATYRYGGWACKVDTKARRMGVGIIVRFLDTDMTAEFDSIHECALVLGLKDQKVRSLINAANNIYDNKRFTKKPIW